MMFDMKKEEVGHLKKGNNKKFLGWVNRIVGMYGYEVRADKRSQRVDGKVKRFIGSYKLALLKIFNKKM